jgi:glycosyltransferase involved in cell wall biosynthesis
MSAIRGEPLQSGLLAGDWPGALRQAGGDFDLTVVLLARLWPHVEASLGRGPVVLDYIDALGAGARFASTGDPALWRRLYWKLEAPRLEALESRAAERCALLLATSARDAAALPPPTCSLPLGVEIGEPGGARRGPVVAFSGRLGYRPNEIAVKRLVENIWPRVVSTMPEAELRIGGADPPRWLERVASSSGILLVSPVPDMPRFLREARVVAAPVALGSGTQLKIYEALEAGAAVVASPEVVARSATADFVIPARIASSDEAFADEILSLLRDPDQAAREGAAGRAAVVRHADRERFTGELAGHFLRMVA